MIGLLVLTAALTLPPSPAVHVIVHVPLGGTKLSAYQRELRQYGRVINHIGAGTWTNSHNPTAPIVSELDDHIEVVTDLRTARSFLPTFLRLLRIEQNQTETLGEILGGAYGTPDQTRTRIVVRLTTPAATAARLGRLHRIFANDGDGGDSTYADGAAVIDYSGVRPADAPRIEGLLTRAGFTFATGQETFITDDAATP